MISRGGGSGDGITALKSKIVLSIVKLPMFINLGVNDSENIRSKLTS